MLANAWLAERNVLPVPRLNVKIISVTDFPPFTLITRVITHEE